MSLCLLSPTHPSASGYFLGAAGLGGSSSLCSSCAPQSPVGWKGGLFLAAVAAWLGCIPGPQGHPRGVLGDFARPCTLYLMGAEPARKAFLSPFLRAAPSHPLSGRAAELRETGAVCLLGSGSSGVAVGFADFPAVTTRWRLHWCYRKQGWHQPWLQAGGPRCCPCQRGWEGEAGRH